MLTLLDVADEVQCDALAELFELADTPPEPEPPAEPTLPLADWIYAQSSLFRSPVKHDEAPLHDDELRLELIADALVDLAVGVKHSGALTPAAYLATGAYGRIPAGWIVSVPDERASYLAGAIDDEARPYLALDTPLGDLVAVAILALAEDAEQLGASSATDYVRMCEQRDAERLESLEELLAY